jgi:site-specific recombinase XerD
MESDGESTELVTVESGALIETRRGGGTVVPAIVAAAGDKSARRFLEFFAVTIDNPNTRAAYFHACQRFFAWCDRREDIGELVDIEPMHVAAYIRGLGKGFEKPTVKQHLAAIRMLFDWLVTGQIVATNPAHAVRGPKHVVKKGKTSVLDGDEAKKLLDSIDVSTIDGLRDRALIALLVYSFARVSAALHMNVEDYCPQGKRWWLRLHENVASSTKCRRIICWRNISTST